MRTPETIIEPGVDGDETVIDNRFGQADVTAVFVESVPVAQTSLPFEGSGRANSSELLHSASQEPRREAAPRWSDFLSVLERRYRAVAQATVFIALSAGIGAVAYEQWSLAESLQSALDELSSAQPLVHQSSFDRDGFRSQPAGAARIGRRANVEPPSAERDELETRGASLVATNNLAEALSHYRMLANRFPNDRLVRDFVKVLESKQSCDGAGGPRGAACP